MTLSQQYEQYGYHSITIGEYNTWNDWRMIPDEPPTVVPPVPVRNSFEIPGRDGELDITESLDYRIHYGNRKGNWKFYINHERLWDDEHTKRLLSQDPLTGGLRFELQKFWRDLSERIYGQKTSVYLNDDAYAYGRLESIPFYMGRVWVSSISPDRSHSIVTLNYDLLPYRYSQYDPTNENAGRVGL